MKMLGLYKNVSPLGTCRRFRKISALWENVSALGNGRRPMKTSVLCRGSCFLSYTAESSHHLMAKIISKEALC
jgi:hypothetical protein